MKKQVFFSLFVTMMIFPQGVLEKKEKIFRKKTSTAKSEAPKVVENLSSEQKVETEKNPLPTESITIDKNLAQKAFHFDEKNKFNKNELATFKDEETHKYVLCKIVREQDELDYLVCQFFDGEANKFVNQGFFTDEIGKLRSEYIILSLNPLSIQQKNIFNEQQKEKLDRYLGIKISPEIARKYATFNKINSFGQDEYVIIISMPSFGLENKQYDLQKINGGDANLGYLVTQGHEGERIKNAFIGKLNSNQIDEFIEYLEGQSKKIESTEQENKELQNKRELRKKLLEKAQLKPGPVQVEETLVPLENEDLKKNIRKEKEQFDIIQPVLQGEEKKQQELLPEPELLEQEQLEKAEKILERLE